MRVYQNSLWKLNLKYIHFGTTGKSMHAFFIICIFSRFSEDFLIDMNLKILWPQINLSFNYILHEFPEALSFALYSEGSPEDSCFSRWPQGSHCHIFLFVL